MDCRSKKKTWQNIMLSLTKKSRVETLQHRSLEVAKSENSKSRNRHIAQSFGYQEIEMSQTLVIRSPKVLKCEILKTQNRRITQSNGYWDFRYQEVEKLETLNIRSLEVPKCEIPKT
jgi:hypothetical protein